MADWIGEAAKYFGKKRVGKDPTVEKMEEAIGSVPIVPDTGMSMKMRYDRKVIPKIEKIEPIPDHVDYIQKRMRMENRKKLEDRWEKLQDRSTEGSPPFSDVELKQGYRKVGKGRG